MILFLYLLSLIDKLLQLKFGNVCPSCSTVSNRLNIKQRCYLLIVHLKSDIVLVLILFLLWHTALYKTNYYACICKGCTSKEMVPCMPAVLFVEINIPTTIDEKIETVT